MCIRDRGDWTDCRYTVQIEHLYPLTEDEDEERKLDLQEVAQQVRSRKGYLDKWQPDTDATEEIKQMALEREQLEEASYRQGGMGI